MFKWIENNILFSLLDVGFLNKNAQNTKMLYADYLHLAQ